jgi:hypothetical protein
MTCNPRNRRIDDTQMPIRGHPVERGEERLDDVACGRHRTVNDETDLHRCLSAVILSVDQTDRNDDQVPKIKLTTPPRLIPPFHKTAASGTLPTEHTKLTTASKGPIIRPRMNGATGSRVKNTACNHWLGTMRRRRQRSGRSAIGVGRSRLRQSDGLPS